MSATDAKLKTTVLDEFLKDQYNNQRTFQQLFNTFEEFEKVMKDDVDSCIYCGCLAWRACSLPCDCAYEESLKMLNH